MYTMAQRKNLKINQSDDEEMNDTYVECVKYTIKRTKNLNQFSLQAH